jgi:hypothetical protein
MIGGLLGVFAHYLRFGPKDAPPDDETLQPAGAPPRSGAPEQRSRP